MSLSVIPGWTLSSQAAQDFIELAVDRHSIITLVRNPVQTASADHGRTKYIGPEFSVIVNESLKRIIAFQSTTFVSEEVRLLRSQRLADTMQAEREALLATRDKVHPGRPAPLVRRVRPSPVVVRPLPSPEPEAPPTSFDETTVEDYSAFWRDFYRRKGMLT